MHWPGSGDILGRGKILSFMLVSDQKERSILELCLCHPGSRGDERRDCATMSIRIVQAEVDTLRDCRGSLDRLKIIDFRGAWRAQLVKPLPMA